MPDIKIEVDNNGNFTYYPALLHAGKTDSVTWTCDNGPFTVSFPDRTPFDAVTIPSGTGTTSFATEPKSFREDVESGIYHYRVAVAVAMVPNEHPLLSDAKVLMDGGCPGVEIP